MTQPSLTPISPARANELIAQGALLVDVRSADEHARERIDCASCRPLESLTPASPLAAPAAGMPVIFHCRSGQRTRMNADRLAACAAGPAYWVDGGLDAWKAAGLPAVRDRSRPLELMRQVQIAAGVLILSGVALGVWVSPAFYGVPAFVGAGLLLAGASGWCGMARLLAVMPWNRAAR